MEIKIFKNISLEDVEDQLINFDSIGIIKFDRSTSAYQLITTEEGPKSLSFDLDGNIQIGNSQPENGFAIKLEEAK